MAASGEDRPRVHVADRAAWRTWLHENATTSSGIWLVYDKGPDRRLGYDDIVEEALCFGWVDSRPRVLDDQKAMIMVAPRRPTSSWSRINKERVARLTEAGLMAPPGLAAVEAAKANGRWNALDAVEDLTEPDDLRAALDAQPVARAQWDAFPRSAKRAILEWITGAKRPRTRADRIERTVSEAAQGRRANQWRQPGQAG